MSETARIDALKDCPFCGGNNIKDSFMRDGRSVGCSDCGARVGGFNPYALDKAMDAWNTRLSTRPRGAEQAVAWASIGTMDGHLYVREIQDPRLSPPWKSHGNDAFPHALYTHPAEPEMLEDKNNG